MSGTCGSLSQFFQPLIDQGLTGEGTHIIQYIKDVNDVAFADDEFVQLFHETADGAGPRRHADDVRHRLDVRLVHGGHPRRRRRRSRAASTGATSRSRPGFIDAQNPLVFDGITQQTNGFEDAYLIEGGRMAVYEVDGSERSSARSCQAGELLDNNGGIGNYDDFLEGAGG